MDLKGSLPHSQQLATCPYPEADWSSPCPHPISQRSTLILSSHLQLGLPSGLIPSGFPTKTLYAPFPHTCYMPCPSNSSLFNHPNDQECFYWSKSLASIVMNLRQRGRLFNHLAAELNSQFNLQNAGFKLLDLMFFMQTLQQKCNNLQRMLGCIFRHITWLICVDVDNVPFWHGPGMTRFVLFSFDTGISISCVWMSLWIFKAFSFVCESTENAVMFTTWWNLQAWSKQCSNRLQCRDNYRHYKI